MTDLPSIAVIGLGEVGTAFAEALRTREVDLKVASRPSVRAFEAAKRLGVDLDTDVARAASTADIVLLTTTGDALHEVVGRIAPVLRKDAILADLTAGAAAQAVAAADMLGAGRSRFVDVAIMGAVSLYGVRTPLLASGDLATEFATRMNALGFAVSARERSAVGDASSLKLLRSLFAKGLDALVVESMLAAEALGLRHDLVDLLSDFDARPLRDHVDMYLRTHPQHAARRLAEMELSEAQLESLRLPSLTTRATIERYRRTVKLTVEGSLPSTAMDASGAIAWLLASELRSSAPKD